MRKKNINKLRITQKYIITKIAKKLLIKFSVPIVLEIF